MNAEREKKALYSPEIMALPVEHWVEEESSQQSFLWPPLPSSPHGLSPRLTFSENLPEWFGRVVKGVGREPQVGESLLDQMEDWYLFKYISLSSS